ESAGAILARSILEEERDRHVEYRRNRLQAARADAVRALLISLDLLECDAEQLSELLLAHAEHVAAQPDATADVYVYWIWFLLVFIHRISCPGKAGRQTVRSFYLETRLEPQIRTTALTQVYRLFHYDLLIYCVSIDTRGRTQAGNDPDRHQERNHKPTNDFWSCHAQRVGAFERQRDIERADAVEFQRVHDPTERIDRRRDAVVGGAQHRQAGLDRAKLGLAQMLVRSGRVAEPRVVGDVGDKPGVPRFGGGDAGIDHLVANVGDRLEPRRHLDGMTAGAGGEAAGHLDQPGDADLRQQVLEGDEFAERHQMHLVGSIVDHAARIHGDDRVVEARGRIGRRRALEPDRPRKQGLAVADE